MFTITKNLFNTIEQKVIVVNYLLSNLISILILILGDIVVGGQSLFYESIDINTLAHLITNNYKKSQKSLK